MLDTLIVAFQAVLAAVAIWAVATGGLLQIG